MNYGINNNPLPPELEYAFRLQEEAKNRAAQARQNAMNPQPAVPEASVVQQLEKSLFSRMAPGVMQQGQRTAQQPMRQGQAPMGQAQAPMRQAQQPMRQGQAPNAAALTPQQNGRQLAQGLSGVSAPNMQRMANGGIVGYAGPDGSVVGANSKGPIPQMSPEENAQMLKYLEGLKKFDYYDKNPDKVSPEGRQALEADRRAFEAQFPNAFRQKVSDMMYGPSKGMAMGGEVKKFQTGKTVTLDLAPRPYTANGRFYNANGQEISEQDFNNEMYLADQYDERVRSQANITPPAPAEQSSDTMSNEARLLEDLTRGFDRVDPFVLKEQLQEVADDPRKNSSWARRFGGALEVGGEALTKTAVDVLGGLGEYGLRTAGDIGYGFGTTGAVGEAVETTSEAAKQQAMELLNADYASKREALRAQLQVNGGDIGPEARARIEAELAALQEAYDVDAAKLQAQTGITSLKEKVGDFYKTNIGGETTPESEEVKPAGIAELIEVDPTASQKLGSMVNKPEAVLRDNKDDEPEKGRSFVDKLAGIAGVLGRGAGASKGYEASRILETTRDLRSAEADRAARLEEQNMLIGARKDIAAEELAALTNATQQEQLIMLRDQILSDMADGSGQLGSLVDAERKRLEDIAKPNMFGSIDPTEKASIEKQMAAFKATLLNTELQKALTQISQMQNQFKGLSGSGGIQGATGIGSYLDLEEPAST